MQAKNKEAEVLQMAHEFAALMSKHTKTQADVVLVRLAMGIGRDLWFLSHSSLPEAESPRSGPIAVQSL
jgi:hypothetical protein